MKKVFDGREIEIIDFGDVAAGERVIEFRDPAWRADEAIIAISVPDGRSSSDAVISINPHKRDVSVPFVVWAVGMAQERLV